MNSDLSRIQSLLGIWPSGAGTPEYDAMPPFIKTIGVSPLNTRKPRSKKKNLPPAAPDPFINPQPGDQVSANGRTRHVQRIEHGNVVYNLGDLDSRDHTVSLAGWRAWCKEYGRREG